MAPATGYAKVISPHVMWLEAFPAKTGSRFCLLDTIARIASSVDAVSPLRWAAARKSVGGGSHLLSAAPAAGIAESTYWAPQYLHHLERARRGKARLA
jgi:hypothetical protein